MSRRWFQTLLAVSLTVLPLAAPALGAESDPTPVAAQELVFGNGTEGPFSLSWTALRMGSERITVNGTRLHLALDYHLDYETGQLSFTQPLRRNQVAQVEYVYDGARAKQNHAPAQVPLAMSLWDRAAGRLQMIGSVRPGATPAATPSASLLGFRGETALGGGQLSSLFLMAPEAHGASRSRAWQTAALRFGASREAGPFKFRGSYGQAGTGFTQAKEYQLQQGLRVMDFAAAFDPSKRFSFSSQVSRQAALDPTARAKEQTTVKNQLTLTPSGSTKLTLAQESASRARSQGGSETTDALRAQIEQKLGGRVTATALAQQRTDAAGTTTTTGLALDARAAPQLRLRTDLSRSASQSGGRTDRVGVGLQAGREQSIALSGDFNRTLAEKSGAETQANLRLTVRPAEQLGFRIGYQQQLSDRQGDTVGSDWGLTAGRNGMLKVERRVVEKVAASGLGEQSEQLRVEAAPLKGVKLTTLRASRQVGSEAVLGTRETSLELTPLPDRLRVAGALRDQETGDGVARVRSVSGALTPAPFLDLSGAYKTREAPAGDQQVTRDVRLALTPTPGLKLHGAYTQNAEDENGQVLDATRTSVGLESTIGSLMLGGTYTTGAAPARDLQQTEFRLALNLWGNSRFYGTYEESEEQAGSLTHGRTLSLGFTRSLGSSLYVLLEGRMTQVQVNGVAQPGLGDQRAQAKLGLRF